MPCQLGGCITAEQTCYHSLDMYLACGVKILTLCAAKAKVPGVDFGWLLSSVEMVVVGLMGFVDFWICDL